MPWPKGKKQSAEAILNRKIAFAKPEVKKRMSESAKKRIRTPEENAKRGKALVGRKRPQEVIEKIRDALKGRKLPKEQCQKISITMKTRWQDPAYRKQISIAHSHPNRKKRKEVTCESRKRMSDSHKGHHRTIDSCLKQSRSVSKEKHWNWKGGPLPSNHRGKGWRIVKRLIRESAKNQCAICGHKQKLVTWQLDVHHIIPYRHGGPSSLDNCIALCRKCHVKLERNLLCLYFLPATASGQAE